MSAGRIAIGPAAWRMACFALAAAVAAVPPARSQGASASAPALWRSVLPDAVGWFGEAGRAGWISTSGLGLGFPPVVAGHARGGWRVIDPERAPEGGPFPGLFPVLPPLVGYDSLAVEPGRAPSTQGPSGALAVLRPVSDAARAAGRPLATFALTNGDFGLDETSLTARRGGDLGRVHLEALSAGHGQAGPYGDAGRHRWGAGLGRRFGAHDVSASFRQAGLAARLRAGEEQASRGASGRVAWNWERPVVQMDLALERQWDAREGFGGTLEPRSRRDAQEVRLSGGVGRRSGTRTYGARVDWHRGLVRRDGIAGFEAYGGDDWGRVFFSDEAPGRRMALELGAGRIGAVDAIEYAPGARIDWQSGGRRFELWSQRQLTPVWHDLAPGERGFLQNTWVAGAGAAAAGSAAGGALRVLAGRTGDRALLARLPLEEQWLRAGHSRDREAWNFGQVWGEASVRRGGATLGAEACGLLRDAGAVQGRVDPALTARVFGQWERRIFGGDLGVRVRLEGDAVGQRFTDEAAPRPLSGYVTGNAALGLEIGDATITLRVRRLENGAYEEVWIDGTTGAPARGTPRELRVAVAWSLKN
ncbi:MAG: hypothetical protein ABIS67_14075 [Candidatus Eisenbacteria bacterium]